MSVGYPPMVHRAGAPVGLVQRCQLCGTELSNYEGAMFVGDDAGPKWFTVGAAILRDRAFTGVTDAKPNCIGRYSE